MVEGEIAGAGGVGVEVELVDGVLVVVVEAVVVAGGVEAEEGVAEPAVMELEPRAGLDVPREVLKLPLKRPDELLTSRLVAEWKFESLFAPP